MLNMRFDGTDTALMVLPTIEDGEEDFLRSFKKTYKEEFGFLLDTKNIIVDDIKVSALVAAEFRGNDKLMKLHRYEVSARHSTLSGPPCSRNSARCRNEKSQQRQLIKRTRYTLTASGG